LKQEASFALHQPVTSAGLQPCHRRPGEAARERIRTERADTASSLQDRRSRDGRIQRRDQPEHGRAGQRKRGQHDLQQHQRHGEPPVRRQATRPVQQCTGVDELERLHGDAGYGQRHEQRHRLQGGRRGEPASLAGS